IIPLYNVSTFMSHEEYCKPPPKKLKQPVERTAVTRTPRPAQPQLMATARATAAPEEEEALATRGQTVDPEEAQNTQTPSHK
ncbi:hypothetical protein M9458_047785, partial [Cirrhinus mrigala]